MVHEHDFHWITEPPAAVVEVGCHGCNLRVRLAKPSADQMERVREWAKSRGWTALEGATDA